jgi:Rrf2 family transcriptional regulator, iron-sulfur cluster assembly transcription factor
MRLSTKSRYGLRFMLDLALNAKSRPVSLKEVALRQRISLKYLEKLIRTLKAAGLIKSRRGVRGGHFLARDPKHISVGEIVRVLEEISAITACSESPDYECEFCEEPDDCLAQMVWRNASEAMFAYLDRVTLDTLVNHNEDWTNRKKRGKKNSFRNQDRKTSTRSST